jgi:hypothetical protein
LSLAAALSALSRECLHDGLSDQRGVGAHDRVAAAMTLLGRTSIAIAVTALVGLAMIAPAKGEPHVAAATRAPTTISCADDWTWAVPRRRPHRCTLFAHNQPIHAYEFDLRRIRWRHWGSRRASAEAVSVHCCMGGTTRTPAKLRAYRRRAQCGHRAYTRLRVAFSDGSKTVLRPPACRRRLR